MLLGEAAVLGLASGPVCIASCGPVLVPSLLTEHSGLGTHSRFLCTFLGARLLGYLFFALAAAQLGKLAALSGAANTTAFGVVHLLLAFVLLAYARSAGHGHEGQPRSGQLVTIGARPLPRFSGVALLGLLTGVSLCPPFVAAGIRAAELGNIASALAFFFAFFLGTSVWFLPFMSLSCVRRNEAVLTVARMAMVLIALYYAGTGAAMLLGRRVHGY